MRRQRSVRCARAAVRRCAALLLAVIATTATGGVAAAFETEAREALLMDMATSTVLFEKNAKDPMPPASMSKIMTVYMVFERLADGRLKLDDTVTVSENAWLKGGARSGGSTMFLEPNSEVTVEEVVYGIVVQSGNDASIAIAEALSGTEEAFAQEMTIRARELGLQNSTFRNATGLPDPEHRTTAEDLAILAKRTIEDFPEYYERFYPTQTYTHNGIAQGNRNPLLYKDIGADGLKTGHTQAAGYGLTASAEQDGRRLILVVNGLESERARAQEAEELLRWGFSTFDNYRLVAAGEHLSDAEVWLGAEDTVPLTVDRDFVVTLTREERDRMQVTVKYDGPIAAPIRKGQPVATLVVSVPGSEPIRTALMAGKDVEQLGFFGRLVAALQSLAARQLD